MIWSFHATSVQPVPAAADACCAICYASCDCQKRITCRRCKQCYHTDCIEQWQTMSNTEHCLYCFTWLDARVSDDDASSSEICEISTNIPYIKPVYATIASRFLYMIAFVTLFHQEVVWVYS